MKTPILFRDNWPALILVAFVALMLWSNNTQAQTDPQHKRTYKLAVAIPPKSNTAEAQRISRTCDSLKKRGYIVLDAVTPTTTDKNTYLIFAKYPR